MSEKCIDLSGIKIGCVMTGSFCTFKEVFSAWKKLKETGAELIPIMSFNASSIDNRFYSSKEAIGIFEDICGKKLLDTIAQVEPIGPRKQLDLLIVAPCTGNTLAKIANGITDTPASLAVKSHLRNGKPVVIAVSTNDALAGSAINIGKLLNTRNIYFVPFAQDDPFAKPTSAVAKFELLVETADLALKNRQIQPVLLGN